MDKYRQGITQSFEVPIGEQNKSLMKINPVMGYVWEC
jgi:hypothetical protein